MFITTVSYGRVRGKARQYPYWQACLYEYKPRKKDGELIARLVKTIGPAFRSERKAEIVAKNYATDNDIFYNRYIRQNYVLPEEMRDYMAKAKEVYREVVEIDQMEAIPLYLELAGY